VPNSGQHPDAIVCVVPVPWSKMVWGKGREKKRKASPAVARSPPPPTPYSSGGGGGKREGR